MWSTNQGGDRTSVFTTQTIGYDYFFASMMFALKTGVRAASHSVSIEIAHIQRRSVFTSGWLGKGGLGAARIDGGQDSRHARPRAVASVAWPSFAVLTMAYFSSFAASAQADDASRTTSISSSVFRQADEAAYRRPPTQLVFVSHEGEYQSEWQSWIGYFRQAGYDCVDLNVGLQGDDRRDVKALSEELGGQVRLLSLPRPPLLFAYSGLGSRAALEHIQSSKPAIGGLVFVRAQGDEESNVETLDKDKLCILVLKDEEGDQGLREAERWMDRQGFS